MNEILADNTMSLYVDKKIVFSFFIILLNFDYVHKIEHSSLTTFPQDDRDILKDERYIDDAN